METIILPKLRSEEDAKQKAKEYLTKIFNNPTLTIDSIKVMIKEFHRQENRGNIEVFSKIEKNIKELDASLKAINQMTLNMTETCHKNLTFYQSWKKITSSLNEYGDDLEKIMIGQKNMSLLSNNLKIYVDIQDQIGELRKLFTDESNIVVVFKQVRYLSYLRVALLEKAKTQARGEQLNNFADHLMCVQEFEEEFFDKFWSYFKDIISLSQEKPEFLVKLLRIIEEDPEYLTSIRKAFKQYNKPDEKYQGLNKDEDNITRETILLFEDESSKLSEILKGKIPMFISENIQNRFKDKQTQEDILEETLELISDLNTIKLKVVPCFPPHYNIFEIYQTNFMQHINEKIKPFLNNEELEKSPGLLIPVAHWLDKYEEGLKNLGVDINETELCSEVNYCMHIFYDHVNNILDEQLQTALAKNKKDKANLKEQKKIDLTKIHSFYATDIYTNVNNVIESLSGNFKGPLMFQIIKIVFEKFIELIRTNQEELQQFNSNDDLMIACVYIDDASKCIEIFPAFKKKIKSLLPKELYDYIKLRYIKSNPSLLSMYNNCIRKGCNKVIQLMFIELEKEFLKKMFTNEWDDNILLGIFATFRDYFNTGFYKLLKTQNNLLIIVRSFIDCFVNYYIEEIIHSVRSLNRKILKGQTKSALVNYQLQYLTIDPSEIVYKEKKKTVTKKEKDKEKEQNDYPETDTRPLEVKDLDTLDKKKDKVFKKYIFPVKKFSQDNKTYNPTAVMQRIDLDKDLFAEFLEGFSDESKEPFSKHFTQTLGMNFIGTFISKFSVLSAIMKCHSSALKEQIVQFKEFFFGDLGKALVEALLYVREDTPNVTKPDMKLYLLDNIK